MTWTPSGIMRQSQEDEMPSLGFQRVDGSRCEVGIPGSSNSQGTE